MLNLHECFVSSMTFLFDCCPDHAQDLVVITHTINSLKTISTELLTVDSDCHKNVKKKYEDDLFVVLSSVYQHFIAAMQYFLINVFMTFSSSGIYYKILTYYKTT